MGRKTTVWIFQATSWRICKRVFLDMATQGKPNERN